MFFGGEQFYVDWVVGHVGVQLGEFGYGGGFTNFAKFLEAGFEAVRLCKSHRTGFRVGVMEHCYPQDVRKWIRINGGWVVGVVA